MKKEHGNPLRDFIKPLGIVFGDIGTSPIYTLTVIVLFLKAHGSLDEKTILGIISLVFWALILVVYIQYTWLAMNLSIRGEGGTIILQEILVPLLKNRKHVSLVVTLSFIALSFIIGDGVITPAISILSAVEGLVLIPGLQKLPLLIILLISFVICLLLFAFQKHGTDKVSNLFSPIMVVWFLTLAGTGVVSIAGCPKILMALNPWYAVQFFAHHGVIGFLVLTEVILAITGGEALYADMGHLGKQSIVNAWHGVFICLVLNYMGQGAYVLKHPGAQSTLFEMVNSQSPGFYIFFLVLTVIATIIASQAMISAMFSIVYQGINTRIMPLLKVEHTSRELSTQIYIGFVNWFLFVCVVAMLFIFQKSANMAVAYGMAVNVTMTLTAVMLIWIYSMKNERFLMCISVIACVIDLCFLVANFHKIPLGGWISISVALLPLSVILLYRYGHRKLYQALEPVALETFLPRYEELYKTGGKIHGTAIFLLRDINRLGTDIDFCHGLDNRQNNAPPWLFCVDVFSKHELDSTFVLIHLANAGQKNNNDENEKRRSQNRVENTIHANKGLKIDIVRIVGQSSQKRTKTD